MNITRTIKWHRLVLALFVTVLIADTVPHPNLSPGLLHSLANRLTHDSAAATESYFSVR